MSHGRDTAPKPFGVVAEFLDAESLLEATRKTREAGYRAIDAFSPVPVHGLTDAIGFDDSRLSWQVFGAGLTGALAGLGLQVWTSTAVYRHLVGGKPFISLPMFFPVLYECTILFSAGAATVLMFKLNGLPKPHHPVFNAKAMDRASSDRYILCVEAEDPNYDEEALTSFFHGMGAESVESVRTSEGY
ncbi:MAG: DUF3341 domain-containing protein [Fimbriimonadaceae bacterium]|nr:DUF3341 domain-containing protein [Fimbriimonadaceae bacterium]